MSGHSTPSPPPSETSGEPPQGSSSLSELSHAVELGARVASDTSSSDVLNNSPIENRPTASQGQEPTEAHKVDSDEAAERRRRGLQQALQNVPHRPPFQPPREVSEDSAASSESAAAPRRADAGVLRQLVARYPPVLPRPPRRLFLERIEERDRQREARNRANQASPSTEDSQGEQSSGSSSNRGVSSSSAPHQSVVSTVSDSSSSVVATSLSHASSDFHGDAEIKTEEDSEASRREINPNLWDITISSSSSDDSEEDEDEEEEDQEDEDDDDDVVEIPTVSTDSGIDPGSSREVLVPGADPLVLRPQEEPVEEQAERGIVEPAEELELIEVQARVENEPVVEMAVEPVAPPVLLEDLMPQQVVSDERGYDASASDEAESSLKAPRAKRSKH